MFKDEVTIRVKAGRGGDGIVSFRHEKFAEKGGPDGGDGGRGGDVVLVGRSGQHALGAFQHGRWYKAENGKSGSGARKSGRSGESIVLEAPLGTRVTDEETGQLIGEILKEGDRLKVAAGGRGGLGNWHFKSAVRQVPLKSTDGQPGEEKRLHLELELIADVGLIGQPNAGKSTLLARLTKARPRIAGFPFSTTEPVLGIYQWPDLTQLVIADLPGLLAGASEGVGLGHEFLRHIRRTRLLVHLVDGSQGRPEDVWRAYQTVRRELEAFDPTLTALPEVVGLSKLELLDAKARESLRVVFLVLDNPVVLFSAHTGEGLEELMRAISAALKENHGWK